MLDFKKIEEQVLKFWQDKKIYEKVKAKNKKGKTFYFLQGPPYTSGKLHIGQAWNNSMKDLILRYKRMQGFNVWDRAGYDMHGLPTENRVQKQLKLEDKKAILDYGLDKFIRHCIEISSETAKMMSKDLLRLGVWMDYENAYLPITSEFIDGEWWFIKKAWEQKRVYKGKKVMHWCASCETALAKHELEYENVKENSIFLKFKVKKPGREYLIVWTTTPWTIPFNLAVMANPRLDYVRAEVEIDKDGKEKEIWILAKDLANTFISGLLGKKFEIIEEFKGDRLQGTKYEHPLYSELEIQFESLDADIHKVVLSEQYVDATAGSGLVHCAPGCGPEDYEVGRDNKIPPFNRLDEKGFLREMGKLSGMIAKRDDDKIVDILKQKGSLIAESEIEHEYPFCWRCHKPVIFRATEQWFLEIEDLREKLNEFNKKVNWQPGFTKKNYDLWTENLRDNSITRQRFWGTPVPIWECADCGAIEVIGSVAELKKKAVNIPPSTKVYLMRHGEAESNVKGIISAIIEKDKFNLTQKGKLEVKKSAEKLKGKIDLIVASDFKRAKQTAEIIAEVTGAKVLTDFRLRDEYLSDFEGKKAKDFKKIFPKKSMRISNTPKEVESIISIATRVKEAIDENVKNYPGKRILFISHSSPIVSYQWKESGKREKEIDSIKSLECAEVREHKIKEKIEIHRPWIDEIKIKCKCGKSMKRIEDIIDVWIDSGTTSWNCLYYPAKTEFFEKLYPADLILEATEQIRLWFSMLQICSTIALGKSAYKAVYCHGMILDFEGTKMSKSLGNIISPYEVIDKHSSDILRYYICETRAGENINFNWEDIKQKQRNLLVFWNLHKLLLDLRNNTKPGKIGIEEEYILSRLNSTIKKVTELFENYELDRTICEIERLFLDLSRVYVQLIRERSDEQIVFKTIYEVYEACLKMFSTICPFVTDAVWQELRKNKTTKEESVHLCLWPKANQKAINQKLENDFKNVFEIIEAGLASRSDSGIGLKWPLAKAVISCEKTPSRELQEIIKRQLNVKSLEFKKNKKIEVKLDTKMTKELEAEGFAREIARKVQDLRKKAGFVKKDKIELTIIIDLELEKHEKFIKERTNSIKLTISKDIDEKIEEKFDQVKKEKIKDKMVKILFSKTR